MGTFQSDVELRRAASHMHFLLTTNAGLEELARAELLQAARGIVPPLGAEDVSVRPWGVFGRVLVHRPTAAAAPHGETGSGCVADAALEAVILGLRSVLDATWHHCHLALPEMAPARTLYDLVLGLPAESEPAPSLAGGGRSFRVSCAREGRHAFTSLEVEREVGGALADRCGARPCMRGFELLVRADVSNGLLLLGTGINREPLQRRHALAFSRGVVTKPNVAYALLALGGLRPGMKVQPP